MQPVIHRTRQFLVECFLPGVERRDVEAAASRARSTTRELRAEGQAVEYVGLPEAQLNLAEAAIYLARAPKSNSVIAALGRAQKDAASAEPVPIHLKEPSGHPGLKKLGFGKGYKYPHDYPGHRVEQEYLPARFSGARYYEPSGEGEETADAGEEPRDAGEEPGDRRAGTSPDAPSV